ncbi:MAG: protein kinase [Myxococcales bacterium]|nr:protein kinase [Myxococcales bacterium]
MNSDVDDELARTATADASQPSAPSAPKQPGETIGRYRIERTLGIGGMGVVHVAFDPDLERRVALKVLRAATGEDAARRLQREARAMARLNHRNVVTVHEVGSVAGRDYVAMELIDGESLAEWLRASRRESRAIVDAFIQAGRGLAAAHAAGIVHRDFKPHNVLRSRSGRICVTDFGLAREATPHDPLAVTAVASGETPSALSGLTLSGSVLGTPAYMAPEQWQGGEVTAQADQFGFCVALWEALSGERPYKGPTVEDLKKQVAEGPEQLDASRIPRKLRPILRRGLDPDRAKRWASMDELLEQLERARRRPLMLFAAIGAALIAAGVLVLVLSGGTRGASCPAPTLDPDVVWSEAAAAQAVALGQGPSAKQLSADHKKWREVRAQACAFEPSRRLAALSCLDGVMVRFDTVAHAVARPDLPPMDAGSALIDPSVCAGTTLPRLNGTASALLAETIAFRLREIASPAPPIEDEYAKLAERAGADPCAEALAQAMYAMATSSAPVRERAGDLAEQAADRCGDDRIHAEVATLAVIRTLQTDPLGASYARKLARAEAAVARVPQADLHAQLAEYRALTDARSDKIDAALEAGQTAIAGYAARGRIEAEIRAGLAQVRTRQQRMSAEDLAAIASALASWRSLALAQLGEAHPVVRSIDITAAGWAWMTGDVAGGHARLESLRRPQPNPKGTRVTGLVVDTAGAPVAGATVVVGAAFNGDSISIFVPYSPSSSAVRAATTGPDGTFVIPDAVPDGIAVAQFGDLRSHAVRTKPQVKLVVAPTSRVSGTVDLAGLPAPKVIVTAAPHDPDGTGYGVVTPVSRDGTFTLDGVPRGDVDVSVVIDAAIGSSMATRRLMITQPEVSDVALAVPTSRRKVTVLVRSTVGAPAPNAQVLVLPGAQPDTMTYKQLKDRVVDATALNLRFARPLDKSVFDGGLGKPGDLAVEIAVPEGPSSACALGLPADLIDPAIQKAADQFDRRINFSCVPVPSDANVVVVKVELWPRFD